ncbi:MAG: UDP-N-acetylmuramoyl-tripeptide--D-alanyl-D-alanine ligase [Paracoccaceae bacterium]|jgi:UDP-N-acetylmuramoyl-tripeptide--D-alanyl-D-alanine ligase
MSAVLWSRDAAVAATGGHCSVDWNANGVSIDTRTLQAGDLFVALQDQRDGHDFVAQALENGAAAAMVSRVPEGVSSDAPLLIVDDVLRGLETLAVAARARTGAKVVAVTGSVGKTGTKEMLRSVLAPQGRVHAAEKSYNNHWGVPLTLARMPVGTDFAVIEIGMNHAGEVAPLSRLARPDVAIVTNVAAVHMAAFDSVEAIAFEKASVIEGLSGGVAVLNADMETSAVLAKVAGKTDALWFGETASDFRLTGVEVGADTARVSAQVLGGNIEFTIGATGRHLAMNALAVLAAVHAIGADVKIAAEALADWRPPAGRGERWVIGGVNLIDDSYNANPLSMAAALNVLAHGTGRRVAFLGDMLELGPNEVALHCAISDSVSLGKVDKIHCVGPLMKHLFEALPAEKRGVWVESSADLAAQVNELLTDGDVVMVKGSLGAKMGLIVDAIKNLGDARPLTETGGTI